MQLKCRVTAIRSGYIYPDKKPRVMLTFEGAEPCCESIIVRQPTAFALKLDEELIFEDSDSFYKEEFEKAVNLASIFQPGGRLATEANLPLGKSAVIEGMKWLIEQYDIKSEKKNANIR